MKKRVSMYQFIIAFLVANFLIIIFSSLSFPSTKEEIAKEQRIAFNFVNVELSAIANFISDIARKNLICDEHLKDKFTIITPSKLSLEDAFNLFTSVL